MEECHYHFASLLIRGEKLKNDGTLVKQPNLSLAEKHLKQAVKVNPRFYKAHYKIGKLQNLQKKYSQSLESFKKCIKIENDFAKAHYEIALLLIKKQDQNHRQNNNL